MSDYPPRLGDLVDDFCPRCKLLLNHAIASMMENQVVKVICQTCFTEHAYRRGEGGKKKPANPRATLFDQVLAKVSSSPAEDAGDASDEPVTPKAGKNEKGKPAVGARYIPRHKTKPAKPRR